MGSDTAPHEDPLFLETEYASKIDPDAILDLKPTLNDNSGSNLDTPAHPRVPSSGSEEKSTRCVNCGTELMHRKKRTLQVLEMQSVIRQWTAPQVVTADSLVCLSCWTLAFNQSSKENEPNTSNGHHRQRCVNCQRSILRTRSHFLHTNTEREARITNVISEWIEPRQLHGVDRICHPCWQRADRVPVPAPVPGNVPTETITLPEFSRAPDSQRQCFCPNCNSKDRLTVPIFLRMKLFTNFNFYIPKKCRICRYHLDTINDDEWDELLSTISNPNRTFTAEHIQDFATFIKERNH